MHKKLFTIAKNTFIETIRQPVYTVIIVAALFLLLISPSLTMFTMSDDNKLLRELGLSTLFLASLFIAIFSASGAVAEEIENKTISTVLSKPVQRPIFIIAKFFGVAAAVTLAHYICTIALLMAIRHGVLETVNDVHDWTVISAAAFAITATFLLSAFFNYAYDWKFSSTAIVLLSIFATLGMVFLYFIDPEWQFNPQNNGINTLDVYGAVLLLLAAYIIVALAVALEGGLITPVVRDCGVKGIIQIDRELKMLVDKAQKGILQPEEYSDSTFTITNLGSYGIEEFTAIINPPNSAILAIGQVQKQPVVNEEGMLCVRSLMIHDGPHCKNLLSEKHRYYQNFSEQPCYNLGTFRLLSWKTKQHRLRQR